MNLLEIDVYIYSGFPKWDLERRGNEIAIFSYIAEERKFALLLLTRGRERVHRRRNKGEKERGGKEGEGILVEAEDGYLPELIRQVR